MNAFKSGAALLGALLLSACAENTQTAKSPDQTSAQPASATQTPQASEIQPSLPASNGDGETKLVIYRTSIGGFAIQPKVFVDGQEAAKCVPNRATTVNVAPGTHQVTAKTLTEKAVTVSVPEGGTAYVKCSITMGLLIGGAKLVVVPAEKAAPKVAKLKNR